MSRTAHRGWRRASLHVQYPSNACATQPSPIVRVLDMADRRRRGARELADIVLDPAFVSTVIAEEIHTAGKLPANRRVDRRADRYAF